MNKIKEFFKGSGKYFIILAIITIISADIYVIINKFTVKSDMWDYSYGVYRDRTELYYQGAKNDLVKAVDDYIDSIAPNSCLNGIRLVELCDKYNFDIKFALAQGQLESHFGTQGIASKTNMVWNVKAYDDKSAEDIIKDGGYRKHPDESIEPYLICLYKNYLVDGKTEKDMFISFTDMNGNRYASNPNYEENLWNIYNRIDKETDLTELINKFRKYKMICGKFDNKF